MELEEIKSQENVGRCFVIFLKNWMAFSMNFQFRTKEWSRKRSRRSCGKTVERWKWPSTGDSVSKTCISHIGHWVLWTIQLLWNERYLNKQSFLKWISFVDFVFFSAVLVLYMKNKLRYSENDATVLYHGTSVLMSFMCIFGGILSDVWLGRFKTICTLSIVYWFASILISVSSMPMFIFSPNAALIIGLLLVSIGAGGITPCVSAFGADQFKMPEQSAYFSSFFSMFYATINVGAFLSHVITPILRSNVHCFGQNDCYPLAFGMPAVLMFIAIGMIGFDFYCVPC